MRLPLLLAALLLATAASGQGTDPATPVAPVPPAAPAAEAPAASTPATPATPAPTAPAVEAPSASSPATPATPAPDAAAPSASTPATAEPAAAPAAGPAEAPADPATPEPAATASESPAADTPAPGAAEPAATPAAPTSGPARATTAPVELDVPEMALSPKEMFLHADIVVQAVMVGLAFASVVTWTVFIVKLIELAAAIRRAGGSYGRIENADGLAPALQAVGRRSDPASCMLRAAARELERSAPALAQAGQQGVKERVASHLDRIEARASRRIARGTGLLATVGSTAPFVGLFGTVWGIMNSFIGIAKAQTTNLTIVAPGIAEALLATGIGLVAAIPAVVIYNLFARATAGYRLQLGDASASVQRLVSRELDMNGVTA